MYTVVQGDSLNSIALKLDLSVEAFTAANNIISPNYILPGEVLCVPPKSSTPPPSSGGLSPPSSPSDNAPNYIFQAGDTIAGLAEEFKVTVESILSANNYPSADGVQVGDGLYIVNNKVGANTFDLALNSCLHPDLAFV